MILTRKIIRPAAQAGTNLIVISISLIPMSAKEEGRRGPKPPRGRKSLPRERNCMTVKEYL